MKRTDKRATGRKKDQPRSYGLNDPSNYVVEEWPESKRELYESARLLFWEKGFPETSVKEIVEGAKLTKGAFYHYFSAKEDLLKIMYQRSLERLVRVLDGAIAEDMPSEDALALFVEEMVKTVIDYRYEVALFWEEYRHLPGDIVGNNADRRRDFVKVLVGVIERGVARGELAPVKSPMVVAMSILGMCQFTHHWYRPEGAMTPAEVGREFARIALQGASAR